MSVYDWSVTAANNDNADANINWTEGQAANSVNDSARAQMAAFAAFLQQINGAGTSAGTGNNYTFTSAPGNALTAYAAGNIICFKVNNTNTDAATLNVDGIGAKSLKKLGTTDLVANDIESGNLVLAIYDGTNFQILSQITNANIESFAALTGGADKIAYWTGASMMGVTDFTAKARDILAHATTALMRTELGLGTAATVNTGTGSGDVPTTTQADARYALEANNLSDLTNTSTALSNLGISNARNITFGTAAPGALATGDVYLRHS